MPENAYIYTATVNRSAMKKIMFTFALILTTTGAFARVQAWEATPRCKATWAAPATFSSPAVTPENILVINEIMYNNPGNDDYEFIELYNSGDIVLQLQGYRFTQGVTFTFPAHILPPGGYVVVAIDSARFRQAFNVPVYQWDTGQALNNSGETITLMDAQGTVVDMVAYDDDMLPWPNAADGFGPSLQLCDPVTDNNDGSNWAASSNPTGVFVSGTQILATPGATNNCAPPPPPSYPPYSIGVVTTVNDIGIPDSIGITCQLQGVVYGYNLRNPGIQFTIIDENNDGIHVFNGTEDFGYQVEEGNEVIIQGTIAQFNGLTQIQPDTVILVSQSNPLFPATVITQLDESTESQLVRIDNLTIVNPAQWTNSGTGFNVEVSNGSTTFQMRIDDNVNIFGTPPPAGPFNLTGIGGQFDPSAPYTEGYQILPRYLSDINLISSSKDIAQTQGITLIPNPAKESVWVQSTAAFEAIRVLDANGRTVFFNWFSPRNQMQLETAAFVPGVYQITLLKGKETQTIKLVVQ